jgi:hypothetical protein
MLSNTQVGILSQVQIKSTAKIGKQFGIVTGMRPSNLIDNKGKRLSVLTILLLNGKEILLISSVVKLVNPD